MILPKGTKLRMVDYEYFSIRGFKKNEVVTLYYDYDTTSVDLPTVITAYGKKTSCAYFSRYEVIINKWEIGYDIKKGDKT